MSTHLPQEIFDNIIDHFHDDRLSLRTCALVSSAWLPYVRVHLFQRITLDWYKSPRGRGSGLSFSFFIRSPQPPSLAQRLLAIIAEENAQGVHGERSGRLGTVAMYVRELYVCEGTGVREWLAHDPSIAMLLRVLPNLRRFEVGRSAASVLIKWNALPFTLKEVLRTDVMASTTLTDLKLGSLLFEGPDELRRLLGTSRSLRVLEVDHIGFSDEGLATSLVQGREEQEDFVVCSVAKTPLDRLVIGPRTSPALISLLLHKSSTVDVSSVRVLTLSISGNFKDFARLLHAAHSLEDLDIALMHDGTHYFASLSTPVIQRLSEVHLQEYWRLPSSDQFILSEVPHLQTLKVNIDVLQQMDDPLPWLCAILRTGAHPAHPHRSNGIQSIWITYSIYLPAPYMDRSANTTIFDGWGEIDDVLGGRDLEQHAYEGLQNVKLDFMLENPIGFGIAPRFMKELVLDSPRLKEGGLLSINAYDTSK